MSSHVAVSEDSIIIINMEAISTTIDSIIDSRTGHNSVIDLITEMMAVSIDSITEMMAVSIDSIIEEAAVVSTDSMIETTIASIQVDLITTISPTVPDVHLDHFRQDSEIQIKKATLSKAN